MTDREPTRGPTYDTLARVARHARPLFTGNAAEPKDLDHSPERMTLIARHVGDIDLLTHIDDPRA